MSEVIQFPSQDALLEISVVKAMLDELSAAFPGGARAKNIDSMLRTYRNNLEGVSEAAGRGAVKSIIRNDERFPSVSRVRAAAHEWTRRNVASPEYQLRHDANRCQSCGASYVYTERWRPAKDDAGRYRLTHDRRSAFLEPYKRDVCGCHAMSSYTPDFEATEYAGATMPITLLPPIDQQRIAEQFGVAKPMTRQRETPANISAIAQEEAMRLAAGGVR